MSKSTLEAPSRGRPRPTETTPLVAKMGGNGGGAEDGGDAGGSTSRRSSGAGGGDGGGGEGGGGGGGLSMRQATLLIAGEMAGSGVLALPRALVKTGWFGVMVMVGVCGMAAFSGKRLADCWTLLEARDPQMRTRKRNPYAIIADQALGKAWSVVVSLAIMVTLFGAGTVYLLMAAQVVEEVLLALVPALTYCTWFLLVVIAMTPLIMFGSPRDFSFMGVVALGSTLVACTLYFIQMMMDIRPYPTFRYGLHGFQDFFLAFGTIMFAFGGASTFPTIQNDMADKTQFTKCVNYSFLGVLCLYLPLSIAGYAIYGESVGPNFATSLTATPLTLAGNIFMAVHLLSAFIIIINPVCQELEELYDVPRDSKWWRMVIRSSLMLCLLFVGETIPRFHTLLALVGSTTVALLTFVLPSYCYLRLTERSRTSSVDSNSEESKHGNWLRLLCYEVMLVGLAGGGSAFIASLVAVFGTAPATPCYLR